MKGKIDGGGGGGGGASSQHIRQFTIEEATEM